MLDIYWWCMDATLWMSRATGLSYLEVNALLFVVLEPILVVLGLAARAARHVFSSTRFALAAGQGILRERRLRAFRGTCVLTLAQLCPQILLHAPLPALMLNQCLPVRLLEPIMNEV